MKGVLSKKKTFPSWHGIDTGSFSSQAIALPLGHGDFGDLLWVNFYIYNIYISFHVAKRFSVINTGIFSMENVFGLPQKPLLQKKKPEGTSSAMFNVGTAAKCCEFKRSVLRLDSMLRELCAGYASY